MAYPTQSLRIVLEEIDQTLSDLKTFASNAKDTLSAGNVKAGLIIGLRGRMLSVKAKLDSLKTTNGLADYAQVEKNDPALDVAAEFVAVLAAVQGVADWITTNFPKDAGGYLLRETWNGTETVQREFTAAQTAGLRTVLDTLIATIA